VEKCILHGLKLFSLTADSFYERRSADAFVPIERQEGRFEQVMDTITVLIVDDSSVMRKIVEVPCGRQVFEAGNGLEALAVRNEQKVNLVLCDINMPAMDGLEFVKQLPSVENAKGVPVVMITTEGSEGHVVQALSAGARGYIGKPFTADQVKEHILPVLAGSLCIPPGLKPTPPAHTNIGLHCWNFPRKRFLVSCWESV